MVYSNYDPPTKESDEGARRKLKEAYNKDLLRQMENKGVKEKEDRLRDMEFTAEKERADKNFTDRV